MPSWSSVKIRSECTSDHASAHYRWWPRLQSVWDTPIMLTISHMIVTWPNNIPLLKSFSKSDRALCPGLVCSWSCAEPLPAPRSPFYFPPLDLRSQRKKISLKIYNSCISRGDAIPSSTALSPSLIIWANATSLGSQLDVQVKSRLTTYFVARQFCTSWIILNHFNRWLPLHPHLSSAQK